MILLLAACAGRVIVCCGQEAGLHELDTDTNYRCMLRRGSFCSGAVFNDQLYVLQYQSHGIDTSRVLKYSHSGVEWVLCADMELDYCRANHNDTLAVSARGLHVTSWRNHNVLLYGADGRFGEYERGVRGEDEERVEDQWRLCGCDTRGRLLLTESVRGKVGHIGFFIITSS